MDAIHLINDEQKGVFEQFREIFKNETLPDRSDVFLLRWLIARNFDLEEAEKMLRNSLLWRKLNRIDYLCNEFQPNEVISKYLPMGTVSCSEKFGEPTIMTSRLGLGDFRGIFESADPRDCLTHVTYALESAMMAKFPQSSGNSNDYTFNQIISIVNLTEFGMRFLGFKPALQWYHDVCKIYEENYPELIRKIFVINAPKIFDMAFSMVKPLLHERTRSKISVFGSDPNVWKAALLAEIPPERLPVCYGGTKVDPVDGNPYCSSLVSMGGEVPKCYYMSNRMKNNEILSGEKHVVVISARGKETLEVRVKKPETNLKWEFHSEEGNVGFSVTRKVYELNENMAKVVPYSKVDSHMTPIRGDILCEVSGLYAFNFDNSFSFLRSKRVWCTITMREK